MNTIKITTVGLSPEDISDAVTAFETDPAVTRVELPDTSEPHRLDPASTFLVLSGALIVGTGLVTRVMDWWRARSDCLLIIDARKHDLEIVPRCDLDGFRGKTIILVDSDTQVLLSRESGAIDIDSILGASELGKSSLATLVESSIHTNEAEIQPFGSGWND